MQDRMMPSCALADVYTILRAAARRAAGTYSAGAPPHGANDNSRPPLPAKLVVSGPEPKGHVNASNEYSTARS